MDDKDKTETELVFRYSRDDRLRRASEAVRRLNDPAARKRPSLMKTLVPNRASAFLLLSIFMLAATVVVSRMIVPPPNTAILAGNRLTLTAFRFQGGTYLALKKGRLAEDAYRGPVDLIIVGSDATSANMARQVVLGEAAAEEFRLSIDGEHERLEVLASAGGGSALLKANSE